MELFYGHLLTPINLAKQIPQSRVLQVKKKKNSSSRGLYNMITFLWNKQLPTTICDYMGHDKDIEGSTTDPVIS